MDLTWSEVKKQLTWDNILFFVLLVGIVGYFGVQSFVLNTSTPQVAVTTTSMVPTYDGFDLSHYSSYDVLRGDLLVVQAKTPVVGDTIVFKAPNQEIPIVHRVVATKTEGGIQYFGTKGDNNAQTDFWNRGGNQFGWIPESEVIGVVIFSVHHIGWLSLEVQQPLFRTALILLLILVGGYWVYEWYTTKDKDEEEEEEGSERSYTFSFGSVHLPIPRPHRVGALVVLFLVLTWGGVGVADLATHSNSTEFLTRDGQELPNTLSLGNAAHVEEHQSDNQYYYNIKLTIHSSGLLNWVSEVVLSVSYNGGSSVDNPSYRWTVVYDWAGSKTINAVVVFDNPPVTNTQSATVDLTLTTYSSGLLASGPSLTTDSLELTI